MHNSKNITGITHPADGHRNQLILKIVQSYNSHVISLIENMTEDKNNSKGQLLNQLLLIRQRITELEVLATEYKLTEE